MSRSRWPVPRRSSASSPRKPPRRSPAPHSSAASPATFGYKPAVWIDEVIRHVERFRQAAPRIFVAMLGGGAGTFASLGQQGPAVQAGMGRHLRMPPMTIPSRALGDHLAENICLLGMLAATCAKI